MLDKSHSCLLIFPNAKEIHQKLGLEFPLNDDQLNEKPFFAVHKMIPDAIYKNIPLDANEFEAYEGPTYYDKLLDLCACNKPRFIDFSPEFNFEKEEILNVMKNLGAKYQTYYSEDIEMVLVNP